MRKRKIIIPEGGGGGGATAAQNNQINKERKIATFQSLLAFVDVAGAKNKIIKNIQIAKDGCNAPEEGGGGAAVFAAAAGSADTATSGKICARAEGAMLELDSPYVAS